MREVSCLMTALGLLPGPTAVPALNSAQVPGTPSIAQPHVCLDTLVSTATTFYVHFYYYYQV